MNLAGQELLSPRTVLGRDITTYSIGGPIKLFFEPNTVEELLLLVREFGTTRKTIGAGSNILIDDEGVAIPVIRLGKGFKDIRTIVNGVIRVGAAASLMNLSRVTAEAGLSGLEFAGGIPASIGGAIMMNAGAHGGEMAQVITNIELITSEAEHLWVSPKEFAFAYRHSGIPESSIIIGAEYRLVPSEKEKVIELRKHNLEERKKRQPLSSPSAGSVFKNPLGGLSAGALIEQAGLKGRIEGGAQVSELHGNWIINPGRKATSRDVQYLMRECQNAVLQQQAINLETEVKLWRT